MRTYARSRERRKSFYRKSELQMFLLTSGGHVGGQSMHSISIQSSTKVLASHADVLRGSKVREMFRQITQKLWATKT